MVQTKKRTPRRRSVLTLDQALIALLIGAMNANDHVSPEEAARAHHIIWSMRQFRRKKGEVVDRLISKMRERIEADGAATVIEEAARAIPARLRPSAFAVAVDLVLADGRIEGEERRFLMRLAADLKVPPKLTREILSVMVMKNGA